MNEICDHLLLRRGLYYRPNNSGYTGLKADAGHYPASRAMPDADVTAIPIAEADDFSPSCDPCTKLEHTVRILKAQVLEMGGKPKVNC